MSSAFIFKEGIPFNKAGYLLFTSDKLEDCIRIYKKYNCNKALFSYLGDLENTGYREDNLELLNDINVKELIILSTNIKNFLAINNQKNLVELRIESGEPVNDLIDFSNLSRLKEFRGYWCKELNNLFSAKSLKNLTLWKYKSKTSDLMEFSELNNLESLHLIQSNITVLNGIEKLKKIKTLELAYNQKLSAFNTLNNVQYSLEELKIEVCRFFNLNSLPVFASLKTFSYLNNGKVESIEPALKKMPLLESLNFSQTDLINGDISYLLNQPKLRKVYFYPEKRHYKFTRNEINNALKNKIT
jgi:hypothetical protein